MQQEIPRRTSWKDAVEKETQKKMFHAFWLTFLLLVKKSCSLFKNLEKGQMLSAGNAAKKVSSILAEVPNVVKGGGQILGAVLPL